MKNLENVKALNDMEMAKVAGGRCSEKNLHR